MAPARPMLRRLHILLLVLFAGVAVHSAYLSLATGRGAFYLLNVLAHILVGFVLAAVVVAYGTAHILQRWRGPRGPLLIGIATLALVLASAGAGVYLAYEGAVAGHRWLLWIHILAPPVAVLTYAVHRAWKKPVAAVPRWRRPAVLGAASLACAGIFAVGLILQAPHRRAVGPAWTMPATILGVAVGDPKSPFFATPATTATGGLIAADAFTRLDADYCGTSDCHPQITRQWESSAHKRSAFNDPYYRRNVEYNEARGSPRIITRFCGACHTPGLLFSGGMPDEGPLDDTDPLLARQGITCIACHSMTRLHHIKGNAAYEVEEPVHYPFAGSDNPLLAELNRILIESKPGPHKETFLKPIHLQPEFCGTCHRVGIPSAANGYGWQRGFDEYGSWQVSALSGHSVRPFYHPPGAKRCQDCHMPLVASTDAGAVDGKVHDHTFAAANTAVPLYWNDREQIARVEAFLRDNRLSVDPVALVREGPAGEETIGPLRDGDAIPPGVYRLEVVVRNRGLGHQFTGGTRDAHEPWLDVTVADAAGRELLRSGALDPDGFLDPDAHVYEAYMVDRGGNRVSRRNAALDFIAMVYGRIIEAGQAEVVRYRLAIPDGAQGPLAVHAALRYRKWNQWYYRWMFGSEADPAAAGATVSLLFDPRSWLLPWVDLPPLPIVTMAEAERTLAVGEGVPRRDSTDLGRWYDYGVGLCAMRDFERAVPVFRRVVEIDASFADGWVGLGRTLVLLDRPQEALGALERARALDPACAPAEFFTALAERALGRYDDALRRLDALGARVPRDRFVHYEIGQIHFLRGDLARAVAAFRRVLDIEPEDHAAHYHLMLCFRALGDAEAEQLHAALADEYRYRADTTRTWLVGPGPYRQDPPWNDPEAPSFHVHGIDPFEAFQPHPRFLRFQAEERTP